VDDVAELEARLRTRLGPLKPPTLKPFSMSFRTTDDQMLVKVYRGVEPNLRQRRELDALRIAPTFGLAVPRVLDHGQVGGHTWTAFEIVPGRPADCDAAFLPQATAVMSTLHHHVAMSGAGSGWATTAGSALSNSGHLAAQLSVKAREMPWWSPIFEALRAIDGLPSVHLHGDLKPEHILLSPSGPTVVDWEASGRGPAACDYADAVFHVTRDLLYAGERMEPLPLPAELPAGLASVLAWRLVIWADRRRDEDLAHLPSGALIDLAAQEQPEIAARNAAVIIDQMRRAGTPR
jgi:aminoglycoside phosphotransferase (APT) family kinase protein